MAKAKISDVADVTQINFKTAGSVVVGMALFGAVIYGIKRLPDNQATSYVKTAASVATGG